MRWARPALRGRLVLGISQHQPEMGIFERFRFRRIVQTYSHVFTIAAGMMNG